MKSMNMVANLEKQQALFLSSFSNKGKCLYKVFGISVFPGDGGRGRGLGFFLTFVSKEIE